MIFRKINTEEIFSNLQSLQINTIFKEKKAKFAKIYCCGICDLYLWSRLVTSLIGATMPIVNIVSKYCLFIS